MGPAIEKVRKAESIYDVRERARSDFESLGLRERHKIDKLDRISAAALLLFSRDGYEKARLRDIAKEAGVALGTLALYARDKRDLILLLFNRLIPPLLEKGRHNACKSEGLADSVTAYFTPFFHAYAQNVVLYRMILGQIFSPDSPHAQENQEIRANLINDLAGLVRRAVESGECVADVDFSLQARSFFYLYFVAVRSWLSQDDVNPEHGIADLHAIFDQHVQGVVAR